MQIPSEFDSIRCYEDEEVQTALQKLLHDSLFKTTIKSRIKYIPYWLLTFYAGRFDSIYDFQKKLVAPYIRRTLRKVSDGLTFDFSAVPNEVENVIYLSNHRDIILDPALLDYLLLCRNRKTVEIGIGDNLLIHPWIKTLVRINKSFIVKRSVSASELLQTSETLSSYMRFTIQQKKSPIWLAQREGRAKDSNDRTQKSVLKMLAMSGEGSITERLRSLNIVPLTISYEYDPCDFLKAKEFQMKRDNPDFKKSKHDDLVNMRTGIFGYKGHIHYQASPLLNNALDSINESQPKNQLLDQITAIIDHCIFSNYKIYPTNWVALDLLNGNGNNSIQYTDKERQRFIKYLDGQLSKIKMANPDLEYLRGKMLEMYSNPLKNYLNATGHE